MTSTATARPDSLLTGATPLILTRVARTHVQGLGDGDIPPRLLIVGTAGSGKTRLVRRIVTGFDEHEPLLLTAGAGGAVVDAPPGQLLVVDDAHLLGEDDLAVVAERVRGGGAVLLATRPWPMSDALRTLCGELEQAQPAVVLGHVTRADVLDQLADDDRRIGERCVDGILDLTGQLTWLVSEALALHDDGDCDDGAHAAIREELRDLIAHRIAGIDVGLRHAIETICLAPHAAPADALESWALAGHAKGLLQRNGRPAAVVRDTVRATTPVERLVELYAGARTPGATAMPSEMLAGVRDPRLAAALLMDGDAAVSRDPRRAAELFAAAGEAGADAGTVAVRRAQAEWAAGRIDAAGALLDAAALDGAHPAFGAASAVAGAVWAARGDLRMSTIVYDRTGGEDPGSVAQATVAAIGTAESELLARLETVPAARALPSTLVVAHELLTRGMRSTLGADTRTSLSDLVRATEMYTASGSTAPMPELPAVLATIAALSHGELPVAQTVIDAAVAAGHGGAWARPRLLLWQAWVAVQRERPHEAEAALLRARGSGALAPRERVLADAVDIALTRRYADAASLAPVWRRARESMLRARFDLYSVLPLGEFAMSAARLGDMDRMRPHLDEAYAAIERLGSPPMWSAPLHWAGLHCSIQLNRPDELPSHARALLAAAPHSRLAKMMAAAGRAWTEVLTGKVDADAVEDAALGLAGLGLAWDGARLAAQGAGRSEDRRVIGRLLACARQLHPREELQQGATDDTPTVETGTVSRQDDVLSTREREVAALVLQGKTYAEIGESIFISPRTAEHHIARIRRRLGATSRSDLIAKLRLVLDEAAGTDETPAAAHREIA